MAIEIHILKERCKGCCICAELCQFKVLTMINQPGLNDNQIPYVENIEDCVGCGMCEMYCPDFAIRVVRRPEEAKIG